MSALFQNRSEAGRTLAGLLKNYAGPASVVLGLSPGGCLVAAEMAHRLGAPLDLLLTQTFAVPCDSRSTLGAVGPGGICVLDDEVADRLDVEMDAICTLRFYANAALTEHDRVLRGSRALPPLGGKTAILVDELITSTLRVRTAVLAVSQHAPKAIVLATPVMTQGAARELRPLVKEAVVVDCPDTAPPRERVYAMSDIPSDAEVRRALRVSEPSGASICVRQ